MNKTNRVDVKKLADSIEVLAGQLSLVLDKGDNPLLLANELAKENITLVFALGELYANENTVKSSTKKVKASVVSKATSSKLYARDALGRFASNKNAV
jgi:hypothetical protein